MWPSRFRVEVRRGALVCSVWRSQPHLRPQCRQSASSCACGHLNLPPPLIPVIRLRVTIPPSNESSLYVGLCMQVIALAEDMVDPNKAASKAAAEQQAAGDDIIAAANGTAGPELSALRIASLAVMGEGQHHSSLQSTCISTSPHCAFCLGNSVRTFPGGKGLAGRQGRHVCSSGLLYCAALLSQYCPTL